MSVFRPWSNTAFRVVLLFVFGGAVGGITLLLIYVRSPLYWYTDLPRLQPVEFDHRHHVADDGIDCRFCHDTVERSSTAGMPSLLRCMACHEQIWNKSPLLDELRTSYFQDHAFRWKRVYKLPDYVYFNHSIHVNKGIGCVTCHGRVDRMPFLVRAVPLAMSWCLECHRDPVPHLRPRDQITSMTWKPPADAKELQQELARLYDVKPRTACTTCHR